MAVAAGGFCLTGAAMRLVALVLACFPAAALATVAADVPCDPSSPPPGPCVVRTVVAVSDGSTLDFGGRGLVVTASGELDAGGGAMTIDAGSLVVRPGGRLTSNGNQVSDGDITVTTTGDIEIQAASTLGKIDVSGPYGGFITLTTDGDLVIAGRLDASATSTMGDGGFVDLTGATVTLAAGGKITTAGGSGGYGDEVDIYASTGSVSIAGTIDTSAGDDGGDVEIEGNVDVTTTHAAVINAKGGPGSLAGDIAITADYGAVSLDGMIEDSAAGNLDLGGGVGGDVSVDAVTTLTSVATIDVSAGGAGASAGSVDLENFGDIVVRGTIDASAPGSAAYGGSATFDTTLGTIDLGGDVTVSGTAGDLNFQGYVDAFSWNTINVSTGHWVAGGPYATITLTGCAVGVASGASLSAPDSHGSIDVRASGQMRIAGPLIAGAENRLEYRDPSKPPIVSYPPVPAPTIVQNAQLIPCGGPTSTTTTTTVPGGSSTTTTHTTSTNVTSTSTTAVTSTTATTGAPPSSATTATSSTSTSLRPAAACAPAECDDGDDCTDDACDPASGCVQTPRPGLDLVGCRLDLLATALAVAPSADIGGAGARARYSAKVGKARRSVEAARRFEGRRAAAKLRRASHLLEVFIGAVRKGAVRRKVVPDLADRLLGLAARAVASLGPFTQ